MMTDTESPADDTESPADTASSRAEKTSKAPIDADGFLELLETVQKVSNNVERMLRRASPKVTLAESLAIRALAADEGDKAKAIRPAAVQRLVRQGYAEVKPGDGGHELSEKGRKVHQDLLNVTGSLVTALGEADRPMKLATVRQLAKAASRIRKFASAQNPKPDEDEDEAEAV